MALAKAALATALKTALNDPGLPGDTPSIYTTRVANNLADAIDTYVKTGTVAVPALGLISASPGAPVTGSATGTIS